MQRWTLLGLAAALAACGGGDSGADARILIDARHDGTPACGLFRRYESNEEHECGLGPPDAGVATCRWQLALGKDAPDWFEWTHSDVVETGTYNCVAGRIFARTAGGTQIEGEFTGGSTELRWDGHTYTRVLPPDAGTP
jgi:hypothetical protein